MQNYRYQTYEGHSILFKSQKPLISIDQELLTHKKIYLK